MSSTLLKKNLNKFIKILPEGLINRYHNWKESGYKEHRNWYESIAEKGQKPPFMVISCCDSRVQATAIFGADPGEFFIHRNIANLIPPFNPNGDHHGTSAAIEFAVTSLGVSHLIVLGHSGCGGINSGYHLCKGTNKNNDMIFVNKWLDILKPAYNNLNSISNDLENIKELEKESIKFSIKNLLEFPFVQTAIEKETLSIHGLWHNIGNGVLEVLDPESMNFKNC